MNLQNQSKHPQMFNHVSKEDKSLAMIMWVLTFFTSFVAPLVIWLVKKEESEYINKQGKNCLNFTISYGIYGIASFLLTLILIGYLALMALIIANITYTILAIVSTNKGEDYVVPFTIEFIK